MKSFAILAVASMAMAQSLSDLPTCGQTCVNNMVSIATNEFGCSQGDVSCQCNNADFGYGLRDCANEACGSQDAASVISYGNSYCASEYRPERPRWFCGLELGFWFERAVLGRIDCFERFGLRNCGASSTPFTTQPLVATISSSGTAITTVTGSSTLYTAVSGAAASASASASNATESAGAAASSATSSASAAASSAVSSASGAVSSATESAGAAASSATESAGSAASSAASGASGAASSGAASATGAAAPLRTAGPMLGAAGMAMLLAL
ncbi:putative cfem domain protein [Diplodia seriata]|uniref:Putative cfem domain protein n=1 Tax=Diplodia seriata TaxID=420778 RepID=A0A0G2GIW7_9PEZI|nr:putative cfem domain protein [Diplodia seriata]